MCLFVSLSVYVWGYVWDVYVHVYENEYKCVSQGTVSRLEVVSEKLEAWGVKHGRGGTCKFWSDIMSQRNSSFLFLTWLFSSSLCQSVTFSIISLPSAFKALSTLPCVPLDYLVIFCLPEFPLYSYLPFCALYLCPLHAQNMKVQSVFFFTCIWYLT